VRDTSLFPSYWSSDTQQLIYGSMSMLGATAKSFGGLVATRMILGAAESGFLPGVIFYLTTFYKRQELAKRLCTFYAATEVAGAFTGLIAFGVFQIESHLYGWQYLFLIEGEDQNSLIHGSKYS
jgi:MFS family permease